MEARLIIDPPNNGKANMQRDLALLNEGYPSLRFYSWQPACISIGYAQKEILDIDLNYCKHEGIELVRRPTGGRAVFHQTEITYSIVWPKFGLSILERYKKIALTFCQALQSLGFQVKLRHPQRKINYPELCFATLSSFEIELEGRKLIGSAQLCQKNFFLQHGSILLEVDYEKHKKIFKISKKTDLTKLMIGLYEKKKINPSLLIERIVYFFEKDFSIKFKPDT